MTRNATRSSLLLASLLAVAGLQAQTNNIAVNNNGAAPDASAILDVNTNLTGAATRGMLTPRVASTAAITVNATTDGMLVYQTGAPAGYYYYNASIPAWVGIQNGNDGWSLFGNTLPFPVQEFFGTTDAQGVSFRTNSVERMHMDATGELGIGVGVPTERVDVGGALRLFSAAALPLRTVLGAPVGFNAIHSATDGIGVIEFQKDTIKAALPAAPNQRRLMWPGHYGNLNGTGVTATGVNPNTGGWRRLNNDYNEIFNAPFSVNGDVTCAPGAAEMPSPALSTAVPANISTSLSALDQVLVNPFMNNTVATRRERMQFMFLRNELNPELNQLYGINGTPSPGATNGLCPGSPINQIGFWINGPVVAGTAAGQGQKAMNYSITVKHAPAGLSNLNGGFDITTDPAQGCGAAPNVPYPTASAGPNWTVFPLTTPFVWDGVRNVIVEVVLSHFGSASNIAHPIKVYTVPGAAPACNLTYTASGTAIIPACGLLGLAGSCAFGTPGGGIVSGTCGTAGISMGTTNKRPVIRFGGTVGTIGAFVNGNAHYIQYDGGFLAEDPAAPPPSVPNWGWQVTPYYAFKGPGTVSAQKGVYDNGVRLNDHVFDRAFDGRVRPEEAADFGDRRNLSIDEMTRHIEQQRHLPTIKGRSDWNREGSFSLGDMANQLWTTTETQTLYITELHDRLNVLELLTNTRPLQADEFEQARSSVATMEDLTEQQKAVLMEDLRTRLIPSTEKR